MMEKPQERRGINSCNGRGKPLVKDLNQHIVCPLCRGYLIDAITLVDCLHSFCRGCIVQRFGEGPKSCPVCNANAAAPLVADVALQRLVYLVVPGLFRTEQERRRNFRKANPGNGSIASQAPLGAPDLGFDDLVSLSLSELESTSGEASTRYLKCPAQVTVRHLLRLLMLKRGWDNNDGNNQCGNSKIEMMYDAGRNGVKSQSELLDLSWTLVDLACIFDWKKEAPMKLLYRIVQVEDNPSNKSVTSFCTSNTASEASSQAIENIQRPPTPPPSPKPSTMYRGDSLQSKSPRSTIVVDQYESKKPRCEVSPLMRAPDPPPIHDRSKSNKLAKLEHKRKKRKNKRVIAEITTTPREDLLKLKVRLTPVPTRVTSSSTDGSHSKDKLLQMRAVRKEKTKSNDPQKYRTAIAKEHKVEEEKVVTVRGPSTEAQKVVSLPEKTIRPVDSQKQITNSAVKADNDGPSEKPDKDEKPKNEEVLRRLGLVAISEANKTRQEKSKNSVQSNSEKVDPAAEREKLEKQLRESKANRVRSLLAEKQMRDTLKSMMSSTKEVSVPNSVATTSASPSPRCETPTTSSLKRKDPPPLTPLRSTKRPNVTFAPGSFTPGKFESPLDLSSPSNNALDLSSNVSDGNTSTTNFEHKPVSILRNSSSRPMDKPKEETKKPQESNLKTLSDAAVSLLGSKPGIQIDKSAKLTQNFINSTAIGGPMIGGKVALRIPQPHQRLTGFGIKIKPNIGVRHIPNPQAVVASQYRNQRTGYFNLAHQPP